MIPWKHRIESNTQGHTSNNRLYHLCRCGFYGNPIYMGYCSKCYKELVRDTPAEREHLGQRSVTVGGTPTHSQLAPIDEQAAGSDAGWCGMCITSLHDWEAPHTT